MMPAKSSIVRSHPGLTVDVSKPLHGLPLSLLVHGIELKNFRKHYNARRL
jgi:hypothetical protein